MVLRNKIHTHRNERTLYMIFWGEEGEEFSFDKKKRHRRPPSLLWFMLACQDRDRARRESCSVVGVAGVLGVPRRCVQLASPKSGALDHALHRRGIHCSMC